MLSSVAADTGHALRLIYWLRLNSVVAAFFPWILWLLKESVVANGENFLGAARRSAPWFGLGLLVAGLCFSDSFILPGRQSGYPERGAAHLVSTLLVSVAYIFLILKIFRQMRDRVGVRRVEIQFLTLNLGIACLVLVTLTSIGNLLQLAVLKRLSIFIFVGSYILTAWAIALHRVFDAREVFLSLGQRLALVLVLGAGILGLRHLLEENFPPPHRSLPNHRGLFHGGFLARSCVPPVDRAGGR